MKTIPLQFVWDIRLKLWAESEKLLAEGNKLWAEGKKLWAEGVLATYGNVTIEWKSETHCIVDGTDEYKESES